MDDNKLARIWTLKNMEENEIDVEEIKKEINNFLFMSLPGNTTISELEVLVLSILETVMNFTEEKNKPKPVQK